MCHNNIHTANPSESAAPRVLCGYFFALTYETHNTQLYIQFTIQLKRIYIDINIAEHPEHQRHSTTQHSKTTPVRPSLAFVRGARLRPRRRCSAASSSSSHVVLCCVLQNMEWGAFWVLAKSDSVLVCLMCFVCAHVIITECRRFVVAVSLSVCIFLARSRCRAVQIQRKCECGREPV